MLHRKGLRGDEIALAFTFEGIAFFMGAIFPGIYIYGWGRIPDERHIMMLAPIMISDVFGSFMVVSVNGWMNAPTGFDIVAAALRWSTSSSRSSHAPAGPAMTSTRSKAGAHEDRWGRGGHRAASNSTTSARPRST